MTTWVQGLKFQYWGALIHFYSIEVAIRTSSRDRQLSINPLDLWDLPKSNFNSLGPERHFGTFTPRKGPRSFILRSEKKVVLGIFRRQWNALHVIRDVKKKEDSLKNKTLMTLGIEPATMHSYRNHAICLNYRGKWRLSPGSTWAMLIILRIRRQWTGVK